MSADGTYNGYANYQTWNVCLWIANDERFNILASRQDSYVEFQRALRRTIVSSLAYETPDGVSWNDSNVNLAELEEFWNENFSQVVA